MARTEVPICTAVSASTTSTASVRRREASACVRATPKLATTCLMADNCSWEAPAASLAPLAICSIDRRSSSAAAEASVRPLDNSSFAAARRSEILSCERAETRLAVPFDGTFRGGRLTGGAMTAPGAVPGFSLDFLMRAMGFSGIPRNSYEQTQSRGHCHEAGIAGRWSNPSAIAGVVQGGGRGAFRSPPARSMPGRRSVGSGPSRKPCRGRVRALRTVAPVLAAFRRGGGPWRACSIDGFLEPLRGVTVVRLAIEALLQRLHDRAAAGQAAFVDMQAGVPQPGTNQRLGTLRVDAFCCDDDDAARHLAVHGERCTELAVDADRRASIDAQCPANPGDQEQQRDARVADDVAQGIDAVVAAPVRQHDGPAVDHADKAGRIAARRAIQPFPARRGEDDEGRGLDEAAIMLGDVVDLLDHGR